MSPTQAFASIQGENPLFMCRTWNDLNLFDEEDSRIITIRAEEEWISVLNVSGEYLGHDSASGRWMRSNNFEINLCIVVLAQTYLPKKISIYSPWTHERSSDVDASGTCEYAKTFQLNLNSIFNLQIKSRVDVESFMWHLWAQSGDMFFD